MTNKNIIALVIIIAGLLGLTWLARPTQNAGTLSVSSSAVSQTNAPKQGINPKGSLTSAQTLHDFGTISMRNGLVDKVFKVSNPTKEDILLESVVTSCMCTTAYLETSTGEKGPFGMVGHGRGVPKADQVIKAGETMDIKVVYDPNAHGPAGVGRIDRFVYLTDSAGGKLTLEIKALVTP